MAYPGPVLPAGYPFSNVPTVANTALYWSATSDAITPGAAWIANLGIGHVGAGFKTNINYVWPVRGGP